MFAKFAQVICQTYMEEVVAALRKFLYTFRIDHFGQPPVLAGHLVWICFKFLLQRNLTVISSRCRSLQWDTFFFLIQVLVYKELIKVANAGGPDIVWPAISRLLGCFEAIASRTQDLGIGYHEVVIPCVKVAMDVFMNKYACKLMFDLYFNTPCCGSLKLFVRSHCFFKYFLLIFFHEQKSPLFGFVSL